MDRLSERTQNLLFVRSMVFRTTYIEILFPLMHHRLVRYDERSTVLRPGESQLNRSQCDLIVTALSVEDLLINCESGLCLIASRAESGAIDRYGALEQVRLSQFVVGGWFPLECQRLLEPYYPNDSLCFESFPRLFLRLLCVDVDDNAALTTAGLPPQLYSHLCGAIQERKFILFPY